MCPRMALVGPTVKRMTRGTKARQPHKPTAGRRPSPTRTAGLTQGRARVLTSTGRMAQAEEALPWDRRTERAARVPAGPHSAHWPDGLRKASLACYLSTSKDDGFLQVFQHKGEHGGGEGHGVGPVDDHEAVVLLIVSLWGGGRHAQQAGPCRC